MVKTSRCAMRAIRSGLHTPLNRYSELDKWVCDACVPGEMNRAGYLMHPRYYRYVRVRGCDACAER